MDESETWYHFYVHAIGAFLFVEPEQLKRTWGCLPRAL